MASGGKETQARSVTFNDTGEDFPSSPSKQDLLATFGNMKWAIASLSLVGVGCAAGFYLAPAGFLAHTFKSKTFFLWMIIALYLPYSVITILQEKFDERFDSIFGPRQTYFFRIIAVQMIIASIFVGYSFAGESPAGVIVCGVLIGAFTAAVLSSTMQLMSAWDPHLAAWASLGKDVAGAFPVLTYFLRDFSASSSTAWEFQTMQLFPIFLICVCALCCTGLHHAGIWDKAYSRLGYDLWDAAGDQGISWQASESDPLLDAETLDGSGQPLWIPRWQLTTAFNSCQSFMLLPLLPFLGSPDLTQKLTLGKLAMDCLARCVAALVSNTDVFGIAHPRHCLMIGQVMLRTALFLVLLAHLLGHTTLNLGTFIFLWLFYYCNGSFLASQIDVSAVRFAPVAFRKAISRRTSLANYSGIALGLCGDIVLIFAFRVSP